MTEIILTSGTSWTVPADCISATVECIGGGQGGNATNGGNGGDYAKANAVALTPGASMAIAIGAGGVGVASGSQNAGGDTSFGSAVLAKGGGSASADVGDVTYAGGAGDASGAGGGAAGAGGAGSSASGTTPGAGDGDLAGAGGAPAAAGISLLSVGSSANSGTTINMSVPITVSAGDTILAVLSVRQGATNTGPAGFTLLDDYIAVSSTSLSEILVYSKTANGTETSVAATSSRSFDGAALQVWKIPGGANVQTFQGGRGGSGATTAWSVGPFTPTNANATVIALWSNGSATTEGTYGVDAAWSNFTVVDSSTGSNIGTASIGWATQQQTTATAATANFTASGTGLQSPTDYMIALSK